MSRIGKSIQGDRKLIRAEGDEEQEWKGITGKGYKGSLCGDENIVWLTVVMDVHLWRYTKSYWIVAFKWVS